VAKRITIQLIGSASDKQDVRLGDFIAQLEGVKKALRETERLFSGKEELSLDYKIVDLRHSSPSVVVLEPVPLPGAPQGFGNEVAEGFSKELGLIKRRGKLLGEPELSRLQAYQDMGYRKDGLLSEVKISVGKRTVAIDQAFQGKLEKILGPDEWVQGSISGFLEMVNLHNTNRFTVYPTIGPKKVTGNFSPAIRSAVKNAIGNFVTVHGKLAYKTWSPFPHKLFAQEVSAHPSDSELPSVFDMRGAMPDITGGLTSIDFIDRIRDENW
jgi:hypothetical protein